MKIFYDNEGRVSEIIFSEGENQAAFWDAYKGAQIAKANAYKESNIANANANKEINIAREKEQTLRNKDYIEGTLKIQQFQLSFNQQPLINL